MEIGIAQRPMRGETACGDAVAVVDRAGGTLIAVVDGLGHGEKAQDAALAFCAFAEGHAEEPLEQIIQGATKAISGTRGVAAALLWIDPAGRRLSFLGIGKNIETQAVSAEAIRPICLPGIIGRPLRKVLVFEYPTNDGDLLLLHTDGVSSRFALADFAALERAQRIADGVLASFGKDHDDATCVVVRL